MSESRFIMQMLREQHETRMQAMRDIIPGPSRIMMHAIKEFAALHCESQSQGDKHKQDIFEDCFRTILATTMQTNLYRQLARATTVEVSLHRPRSDSSRAKKATITHSFPLISSDIALRSQTYTDMDPPNPANAAQHMFTETELLWQLRLSDFGFSHQLALCCKSKIK